MIGYALCGSFCTHGKSLEVLRGLAKKYDVLPIVSYIVKDTDTRFGKAETLMKELEKITGKAPISTIRDAEPLGPEIKLDALIVCPCTGNTLAKLANGITDTPVCMAVKAHLRTDRPLLLALATNDAMSSNLGNIGTMLRRKNVFFVPMKQDAPQIKPYSLVADFSRVGECLEAALESRQIRPLFE